MYKTFLRLILLCGGFVAAAAAAIALVLISSLARVVVILNIRWLSAALHYIVVGLSLSNSLPACLLFVHEYLLFGA